MAPCWQPHQDTIEQHLQVRAYRTQPCSSLAQACEVELADLLIQLSQGLAQAGSYCRHQQRLCTLVICFPKMAAASRHAIGICKHDSAEPGHTGCTHLSWACICPAILHAAATPSIQQAAVHCVPSSTAVEPLPKVAAATRHPGGFCKQHITGLSQAACWLDPGHSDLQSAGCISVGVREIYQDKLFAPASTALHDVAFAYLKCQLWQYMPLAFATIAV